MESYESFLNNLTDKIVEKAFYIQIKDRCLVGVYENTSGDLVCSAKLNDEVYVEYITDLIIESHKALHPEDALYVFIQLFLAYCHWKIDKIEGSCHKEKDEFTLKNMDGFLKWLGKSVIKRVKFNTQIDWRYYPAKFIIKESKDISIHERLNKELSKHGWKISEDFRIWMKMKDKEEFRFTQKQAEALKIFAKSCLVDGMEKIHEKTILSSKYTYNGIEEDICKGPLKDLFASRKKYFDWKKFIQLEGLGFYRLKIPPE